MPAVSQPPLRALLLVIAVAVTLLGIDNAFGGIATLGWQSPAEFVAITDPRAYAIRDSHIRFIAGIWLAIGLVFALSALFLDRMRLVVVTFCGLIFVGGLLRFTQGDVGLLLTGDLLPSLVLELVLFPLVALWTIRGMSPHRP